MTWMHMGREHEPMDRCVGKITLEAGEYSKIESHIDNKLGYHSIFSPLAGQPRSYKLSIRSLAVMRGGRTLPSDADRVARYLKKTIGDRFVKGEVKEDTTA